MALRSQMHGLLLGQLHVQRFEVRFKVFKSPSPVHREDKSHLLHNIRDRELGEFI